MIDFTDVSNDILQSEYNPYYSLNSFFFLQFSLF
jgi:hypothetical protein